MKNSYSVYCPSSLYSLLVNTRFIFENQQILQFFCLPDVCNGINVPEIDILVVDKNDLHLIDDYPAKSVIILGGEGYEKNRHSISVPFKIHDFTNLCSKLCRDLQNKSVFTFGSVQMDSVKKTISCMELVQILTPTEWVLLLFLLQNSDSVYDKDALLQNIWKMNGQIVETHVVESTIYRLRGKLKPFSEKGLVQIETLENGYRGRV